jgi:hypothetical protein
MAFRLERQALFSPLRQLRLSSPTMAPNVTDGRARRPRRAAEALTMDTGPNWLEAH